MAHIPERASEDEALFWKAFMQPRVEIVTDIEGFARLEPEWNALLHDSGSNTIFLTFEWLFTWCRHLSTGRRLFVVTVRQDGRLIAVAPFMRSRPRWQPIRPLPSLKFLGSEQLTSDYLDVIIRRGHEHAARTALCDVLTSHGAFADLVQLPGHGSDVQSLVGRLDAAGWSVETTSAGESRFVSLAGHTWDSYLAGLGSSHRYNVRRRRRNLDKTFDVRLDVVHDEAGRKEAMATLYRLHEMRWQSRGSDGAFAADAVRAFHDEISRRFLALGWLRLMVLRLNGEPVAAFYGFSRGGTYSFFQHGIDPACSKLSVGQVLLGLSIERAIEEGADVYDFLSGDDAYKELWAKDTRRLVNMTLCPPGLLLGVHRLTEAARRMRRAVRNALTGRQTARTRALHGLIVSASLHGDYLALML